jgi:8-oxo-dGTP diphosphatase
MPSSQPTMVVAAIVEREGKVLICQRRRRDSHPLRWEFPGGKVEAGESEQSALAREINEELGISARIGPLIARVSYTYAGRDPVELAFFSVKDFEGEPANLVFEQILWEKRANLAGYDFLEADLNVVRTLGSA